MFKATIVAKCLKISRTSVRNICKTLGLKAYVRLIVPLLTQKQKQTRKCMARWFRQTNCGGLGKKTGCLAMKKLTRQI